MIAQSAHCPVSHWRTRKFEEEEEEEEEEEGETEQKGEAASGSARERECEAVRRLLSFLVSFLFLVFP